MTSEHLDSDVDFGSIPDACHPQPTLDPAPPQPQRLRFVSRLPNHSQFRDHAHDAWLQLRRHAESEHAAQIGCTRLVRPLDPLGSASSQHRRTPEIVLYEGVWASARVQFGCNSPRFLQKAGVGIAMGAYLRQRRKFAQPVVQRHGDRELHRGVFHGLDFEALVLVRDATSSSAWPAEGQRRLFVTQHTTRSGLP